MLNNLIANILCVFLLLATSTSAQTLECSDDLKESISMIAGEELISALDFLVNSICQNRWSEDMLFKEESQFTKVVFEEVSNYVESFSDSNTVVNYSLLNSYPIGEDKYFNQIAFYKQNIDDDKTLQLMLSVIAYKSNANYYFATPLKYYTQTWKEKEVGAVTYHYRDSLRLDRAEKFSQKNLDFALKFNSNVQFFDFYMVLNYQEIMRLFGFDYNRTTVGKLRDGCGIVGEDVIFSVMNNEDFSHDLFHYYSESIYDWSVRNWVVEEGLAYSWGNAYYTRQDGEMAEQKELVQILSKYVKKKTDLDLLSFFENNFWSDTSGIYQHLAPDYEVGRVISSVLCDEVYAKHGIKGIHKLLNIGHDPNHFQPFFEAMENLIGITKSNFNEKVKGLIERYQ